MEVFLNYIGKIKNQGVKIPVKSLTTTKSALFYTHKNKGTFLPS